MPHFSQHLVLIWLGKPWNVLSRCCNVTECIRETYALCRFGTIVTCWRKSTGWRLTKPEKEVRYITARYPPSIWKLWSPVPTVRIRDPELNYYKKHHYEKVIDADLEEEQDDRPPGRDPAYVVGLKCKQWSLAFCVLDFRLRLKTG